MITGLTPADLDAIAQRTAELLEARLRAAPLLAPAPAPEPRPEVVHTPEAMRILGVSSPTAFSRRCAKLGIRRVALGTYRRADLITAIARATLPRKGQPVAR